MDNQDVLELIQKRFYETNSLKKLFDGILYNGQTNIEDFLEKYRMFNDQLKGGDRLELDVKVLQEEKTGIKYPSLELYLVLNKNKMRFHIMSFNSAISVRLSDVLYDCVRKASLLPGDSLHVQKDKS